MTKKEKRIRKELGSIVRKHIAANKVKIYATYCDKRAPKHPSSIYGNQYKWLLWPSAGSRWPSPQAVCAVVEDTNAELQATSTYNNFEVVVTHSMYFANTPNKIVTGVRLMRK